jgi:hypothetical protein
MPFPDAPPDNFDTYVTLGDIVLDNASFLHMLDYVGGRSWMDDSSVNVALEALCQMTDCTTNKIDVFNSNFVQVIYSIVRRGNPQSPDYIHPGSPGYVDQETLAAQSEYDFLRERFQDKRWIFVPINDGVDSPVGSYDNGTHWSLALIDRVHRAAFYYDSMGVWGRQGQIAEKAVNVILMVLGEKFDQWAWLPQVNSPNQMHHNLFPRDKGPCGPFIFCMTQIMMNWIMIYQRSGREYDCNAGIDESFPAKFGSNFHSLRVRADMQNRIVHCKRVLESRRLIEEYDRMITTAENMLSCLESHERFRSALEEGPAND